MLNKRAFVTGALGATLATAAQGQAMKSEAKKAASAPAKKTLPHGMVKTTKLFKSPPGFVNGLAVAPEGLWLGQQKVSGKHATEDYHLPEPTDLHEAAWLVDW